MPIYRLKNYKRIAPVAHDIEYHEGERRISKESVCVHFGHGDVLISSGTSRSSYSDELNFSETSEPHEIEFDKHQCLVPVRFAFDKRESIDVLIAELQALKEGFPPEK